MSVFVSLVLHLFLENPNCDTFPMVSDQCSLECSCFYIERMSVCMTRNSNKPHTRDNLVWPMEWDTNASPRVLLEDRNLSSYQSPSNHGQAWPWFWPRDSLPSVIVCGLWSDPSTIIILHTHEGGETTEQRKPGTRVVCTYHWTCVLWDSTGPTCDRPLRSQRIIITSSRWHGLTLQT